MPFHKRAAKALRKMAEASAASGATAAAAGQPAGAHHQQCCCVCLQASVGNMTYHTS